jgi:hypothetical protein
MITEKEYKEAKLIVQLYESINCKEKTIGKNNTQTNYIPPPPLPPPGRILIEGQKPPKPPSME